MAIVTNATPLIALDAYVLDTETTGLDPIRARIVEIAAVPLKHGVPDQDSALRFLVHPGEPIPKSATDIHHIDDAAVASAPAFATVWQQLAPVLSGSVLIGHTLGFDLAVIKRECERADLAWTAPRTLDTALLAQLVAPTLGGFTLEHLASWLDLVVENRHSALGDALLTARIFTALVPRLRDGNIRTLAEAEHACLVLTSVLDEQHRIGWEKAVTPPREERSLAYIDPYPYRHRVADVMSVPPRFIADEVTLAQALRRMEQEKVSSLLVTSNDAATAMVARDTGIITERDVLRALAARGADALVGTVGEFCSRPLVCLPSSSFVYRAVGRMSRLKLRHLGVENERGEVCGVVSARDLLRTRTQEAAILGDALDQADDVPALAAAWARLPQAAAALIAEGVSGRDIAAVISRELGALTRRAAVLAERRLKNQGQGDPPCAYALCVLGSGGRGESLLAMDQDNAIVFAEGEPGGDADRWFGQLGSLVADILHEVGVPYCSGGVMAKNEQWRGSVATWHARIADWIRRSRPADLLSVDIFFDLVGVHGERSLAQDLWLAAFAAAQGNVAFAKLLAEISGELPSGLTMFGGVRSENGRIDLKKFGLFGIVSVARVLAVRYHLLERATPARLAAVAALGRGQQDLDALARAHGTFMDLMVAQQISDIQIGLPPTNKVVVKRLSREQRRLLENALGSTQHLNSLARDLLF